MMYTFPFFCFLLILFITRIVRKVNAIFVSKRLKCLRETYTFHLHDKTKHIATGTTSKALINTQPGCYMKRRRFFIMKRTKTYETAAGLFKTHIIPYHFYNISSVANF